MIQNSNASILANMIAWTFLFAASGDEASVKKVDEVDADAVGTQIYKVTSPPAALKLDPFYKKYISANGYPIVSSDKVSDYALYEAAYLVNMMLARREDVRRAMIDSGSRLIVMSHTEMTTDVPEHSRLIPSAYWDRRARGLGGSQTDPVCSCGEENLLAFPGDVYNEENILIHEFAHNIHLRGVIRVDETFDSRLEAAYQSAMKQGLWAGAYGSSNHHEYFAEGVQSWFDDNRENDHDHNHVNTRKELIEYDPALAALCEEVFGETQLAYVKPTQRKVLGHLEGYDFRKSPTFEWPEGLVEGYEDAKPEWEKERLERLKREKEEQGEEQAELSGESK
jgi:hypothetical protein